MVDNVKQVVPRPGKRKIDITSQDQNGHQQKRPRNEHASKQRDARAIATQTQFKAFKHGELDVEKFIQSREYEIRALESGLINSKKALAKRAFQQVPKDLRRRTASHNVQRVPKRLRSRARKEMKEDNTPTVTVKKRKPSGHMRLRLDTAKKLRHLAKDSRQSQVSTIKSRRPRVKPPSLAAPPVVKAKFRKRQKDKSWLPTHMFHAKRARMSAPSQPLWRFSIPLTPNAKSYRSVHRATATSGAMAWDTSYYSTIQLKGRRSSLNLVLKSLGIEPQLSCFRQHHVRGWLRGQLAINLDVYHREKQQLIAPVSVIWAGGTDCFNKDCHLWLRVHPAAFLELWHELLRVSKIAKPHVSVVDLRFEIGSIEIAGQEAADALLSILNPVRQLDGNSEDDLQHHLPRLRAGGAILIPGSIFAFDIDDPRLHHPPRRSQAASDPFDPSIDDACSQQSMANLFDKSSRFRACTRIASQRALDRRRRAATPGQLPQACNTDPSIPVLLFSTPVRRIGSQTKHWTLMLPWRWVQIVWYCLMHSPLPSGLQPSFGGLDEHRSLMLEHGSLSFPADYPASTSGWEWELHERQRRYQDWHRRPKSKRVNWDTLAVSANKKGEFGLGWACDWNRLLDGAIPEEQHKADACERPAGICHLRSDDALKHLRSKIAIPEQLSNAIFTVRIEALPRGVPQVCARIYRLPQGDIRKQWLKLHPAFRTRSSNKQPQPSSQGLSPHEVHRKLAQSLISPTAPGDADYPGCEEQDMIGFVTSGNYDLGKGKGLAIGCLSLRLVQQGWCDEDSMSNVCIVRNSGQTVGRLARWEVM